MIEILVDGQPLDILQNPSILIQRSIADIREPESRESEWTKTIEIPGTSANNKIFSHLFEVEQTVYGTSFNPNIKADCIIYADGVEQLRGFLRLISIKVDDSTHITYEVTCHGQSADFFTTIAERKLNQLDFSEYNHTLSSGNVFDSWDTQIQKNGSPQAFAYGDGYVYAMIDKGHTRPIDKWEFAELSPSLYAKTIVDKIFEGTGFSYTNDSYFNNERFKRLIIPSPNGFIASETQLTNRLFLASRITSALSLDIGSTLIFNNDTSGGAFDNGNNYNPSTGAYTVPVGGTYSFFMALAMSLTMSPSYRPISAEEIDINVGMYINGILSKSFHLSVDPNLMPPFLEYAFTDVQLGTGDVVLFKITQLYDWADKYTLKNTDFDLFLNTTSTFENDITAYSFQYGESVDFGIFFNTEVKQSDLMMSFVKMFNLYIEPNKNQPKVLRCVPRDEFFNGTQIDWSAKLDYSQPVEIVPMGELEANPYKFTYREGKDDGNIKYQEGFQNTYGSRVYTIDNDFIKNEKKIEIVFVPTQIKNYDNGQKNFVLSSVEGKEDGDLRVLYYGGLQSGVSADFFVRYYTTVPPLKKTSIPLTLHYDSISTPTFDLLFGMPREIGIGAGYNYSNSNLVNNFYYRFLSEITGKNSKILRAYFRITPKDWLNLSFSDAYFFEGQYWRLNQISDYNPIEDGVYLCEFLLAQFIQPAVPVIKKMGAGTGQGSHTDNFGDIYPGGQFPLKPGIKGVSVGNTGDNSGVFVGDGISGTGSYNATFGSTDIHFPEGVNESVVLVSDEFEPTKSNTLYVGNYEMYPSFLSGGAVRTETTNYNVTKDDWLVLCDGTAGGFTVTLPDPSGLSGKHWVFLKTNSAHSITIDTATAATINGADTEVINNHYEKKWIVCDGTNYFVIGNG
jgi:hypothetical protein